MSNGEVTSHLMYRTVPKAVRPMSWHRTPSENGAQIGFFLLISFFRYFYDLVNHSAMIICKGQTVQFSHRAQK
jgi:hypothetical protein